MRLKEMPDDEKPRERIIKYGVSNVSNEDLISVIIGSGFKNVNVKEVSSILLSKINEINNLDELSIRELTSIKGIGKVKALSIIAAIELGKRVSSIKVPERVLLNNTDLVHKYFAKMIAKEKQENLLVILLDNKKRLISYQNMFKGTDNSSIVGIKEILNYAIKERASAFIIMHNHPSGEVIPSEADIKLTKSLIESGKLIGIYLVDHIVTNGVEYYSFFKEMCVNET